MNTNQSIEEILDTHAQYYIRKTIEYMKLHGEHPKLVTGENQQDRDSLVAINRIIAAERKDELDRLIDIEDKTFNRWTQKDIAHFFDVVGKRYRELDHLTKEGTQ